MILINDIVKKCLPYTMTNNVRMTALAESLIDIENNNIEGDIVECGVYRGGSMMVAGYILNEMKSDKFIYLFDTFAGMTKPNEEERDIYGTSALSRWRGAQKEDYNAWAFAGLEEVVSNMEKTSYSRIKYVKGDVLKTLNVNANLPKKISLLRLDTDFYESTKIELEKLWPLLVFNGILIIDDYGWYTGSKKATDEFFKNKNHKIEPIDGSAVLIRKAE